MGKPVHLLERTMATRTTTTAPQAKQEEPNILLEIPYSTKMILPARMAGEFLPFIRTMEERYESGGYTYKLSSEGISFKLLSADTMTAAMVTAALTTGE